MAPMQDVSDIDPKEAAGRVSSGAFLLDVRTDDEWAAGHAPEATHIALHELAQSLYLLPTDREIVVVCRMGGRSAQATAFLQEAGLDAINMEGGMLGWATSGLPMIDDKGARGTVI